MSPEENEQARVHRPRSVVILAVLQVIQSLGFLYYGITQVINHQWSETQFEQTPAEIIAAVFDYFTSGIGLIVLAVLMLAVTIGLLRLWSLAWLASMMVQGLGLFAALLAYLRQEPNYLSMFLGILLVFYLNQQEVQDSFRNKVREI
jgi:lysylphosphatidylglycerol synthetase-like protein (DUF2156 family)